MAESFRGLVQRLRELWHNQGPTATVQKTWKFFSKFSLRTLLRHPQLGIPLFEFYSNFHHSIGFNRYTDCSPFKIIYLDPDRIEYYHQGSPNGWGRVVSGAWDVENRYVFENLILYSSLENRYCHGYDWKDTRLFSEYIDLLKQDGEIAKSNLLEVGEAPYGRVSPDELMDHLLKIDDLYDRIRSKGYQSQCELLKREPEATWAALNDTPHPIFNEISVNIYRDGDLASAASGHHRLTIAKILNIDRIPVFVRTRHSQWQHTRNLIRKVDNYRDLPSSARKHVGHPDLRDLTN